MIVKERATSVVNTTIPLLFSENRIQIQILKSSIVDTEASLISELSLLNQKIHEMIEFNKILIIEEYIDYLKKEIQNLANSTMSDKSASKISALALKIRDMSKSFSDDETRNRISVAESKLSALVRHDIKKSSKLRPVVKSKITDLISNLDEKINDISDLHMSIYEKIIDCELIIECCDFCDYVYSSNLANSDGYIVLLEEEYINIFNKLTKEYYKFKGESECPYL